MQSLTRALCVLLTAMMLLTFACAKSVEGESKRWTANTAKVTEMGALYPGFKPAIEARKQAAQQIYDAAASLGDEQKIAKLAEANSALMAGFVGDLDDIDDKMKKLRAARVEVAAQVGGTNELAAKVAASEAQSTLDRVEASLKTGAAADEASATAIVRQAKSDLDASLEVVNKLIKLDKSTKSEAADAQKSDAADKAAEAAAAEAKVAPWKCAYCSSENPHTETSCKSCGAPRGDAKPAADAPK